MNRFTSFSIRILLLLAPLFIIAEVTALSYPVGAPTGETVGGTYNTYFTNIFGGCSVGQVVQDFTSSGVPVCISPSASSLSLSGQSTGSTIFFDGTQWQASTNIFNSGGYVSIGGVTPQSAFEVWRSGAAYMHFRGTSNTALGSSALNTGTTGQYNVAIGSSALLANTTGNYNTALGVNALRTNTGGSTNVAIGIESMYYGQSITNNTALGRRSLYNLTTGSNNVAIGYDALYTLTGGASSNIGLGYRAGTGLTTGSYNIAIGNGVTFPSSTASYQLNIGDFIYGQNIGTAGSKLALGTTSFSPTATLTISGTVQISASGAAAGKILTAVNTGGLAQWSDVFATNVSSSGVVGSSGSYGYLIKYASGGIGLELSSLFETGGFLGIGTTNPRSFIEIAQSGALYMHFRGTNTVALGKYALSSLTTGINNTALGYGSLSGITTGSYNVAIGSEALLKSVNSNNNVAIGSQALYNTLSGSENVAIGRNALAGNTTGNYNVALGSFALSGNTSGGYNIGFGYQTLMANLNGTNNLAFGYQSMGSGSSGDYNMSIGNQSLYNNKANYNVAFGYQSLYGNINGQYNISIGYQSLLNSNSANQNVAIGFQSLYSNSSGNNNIALGRESQYYNISGTNNIALGAYSLNKNLTGEYNVAIGNYSQFQAQIGNYNTSMGYYALYSNTGGEYNVAFGYESMKNNTDGDNNVAIGYRTLLANTGGFQNVAIGYQVLMNNSNGQENIAIGDLALLNNTTGIRNIALGVGALRENTLGDRNVAIGALALAYNTLGTRNIAIGRRSLYSNQSGSYNIALGDAALYYLVLGDDNIAMGDNALFYNTGSSSNIALGSYTLTNVLSGSNIGIGSNSIRYLVNGTNNVALGVSSMKYITGSSTSNIGIGAYALQGKSTNDSISYDNIAIGESAMQTTISSVKNVAIGSDAMYAISSGSSNIAIGDNALRYNVIGSGNLALGVQSLYNNTASFNTALGYRALVSNDLGTYNIAIGPNSLSSNVGGDGNLAIGNLALSTATSNNYNIALGNEALMSMIGGNRNIAIGYRALQYNTNAGSNIALGAYALQYTASGGRNIALGEDALAGASTGSYANQNIVLGFQAFKNIVNIQDSIAIGYNAGLNQTGGLNNIIIGSNTDAPDRGGSNQLNIGNEIYGSGLGTATPWIGINTSSPTNTLDVNGSIRMRTGAFSGATLLSDANGNAYWGYVSVGSVSASGVTGGTQNYVTKFGSGGNGLVNSSLFETGGNVGINTTSPGQKLTISGGTIQIINGTQGAGKILTSDASGVATWSTGFSGTYAASGITGGTQNYVTKFGTGGSGLTNSSLFETGGNVGINTTSPGQKLTISGGTIQIINGTQGAGKILISDASGVASWVTGFSGSYSSSGITGGSGYYIPKFGSGGNGLVSSLIYDNGSYVGLGTTGATSRFEVWSGTTSFLQMRGNGNIGLGANALNPLLTGTGTFNIAIGSGAMQYITNGVSNIAIGQNAFWNLSSGQNNIGIGREIAVNASSASWNTLFGFQTSYTLTTGRENVAMGSQALYNMQTGSGNVAIGYNAFYGGTTSLASSNNTIIGSRAGSGLTTGNGNILIGYGVQAFAPTGSNQLNIGNWIFGTGGNIGIGAQNPTAKLYLNATTSNDGMHITDGTRWLRMMAGTSTAGSYNPIISANDNAIVFSNGTQNNGNLIIAPWATTAGGIKLFGSGDVSIGTGAGGAKLVLDSGISNVSGLRMPRIVATTPVFTGIAAPLGVDGSGNVVISQQGAIPVYTALGGTPNAAINDSSSPPTIGANYDKYFNINARQAFTVTDVGGNPYNCPEFTVGSTNKGPTGCTATPWATYVMTAQNATSGDRYAYQILISDRTDAPFVVRGGTYFSATGKLMNTAGTKESLWFKALTVPTNHSDWLYVNPGVDANSNAISGGGNVGIGNMSPTSKLHIDGTSFPTITAVTTTGAYLALGTYNAVNMLFDNDAIQAKSNSTTASSLYLNPYGGNVGIGLTSTPSYKFQVAGDMAANGLMLSYTGSATAPAWTFSADTNNGIFSPAADTFAVSTAGTERMRIFSNGNVTIGSTTNSAKLRVDGQVMITGGTPGAGKVLTSDASGLATWQTPSGGGSGSSFGRYTSILTTAQTRSAASLADLGLTGGSLPVGTYNFKMTAIYRSASVTTGIGFALVSNGAVIDRYGAHLTARNNANADDQYSTGSATVMISRNVPVINTDYVAILQGTFRVTTAGGVKIQFQSEDTNTVTVQPGSNLVIEQL